MTLPIQTLCGDNTTLPLKRGGGGGGGLATVSTTTTATTTTTSSSTNRKSLRRVCLSAAWADPPNIRKERRRAIYSWSVGYGTLNELDESPFKQETNYNKGKVADNATLLEPRGRRLVTTLPAIHAPSSSSTSLSTTTTTTAKESPPITTNTRRSRSRLDLFAMPGIKTLVNRRRNSNSELTQSSPLVNKNNGSTSLINATTINNTNSNGNLIKPAISLANLRKCETVLAFTTTTTTSGLRSSSSSSSIEPLQPVNRLRTTTTTPPINNDLTLINSKICSRCSSILTLASASKYSLNSSTGFVPVLLKDPMLLCKLCLVEVPSKDACYLEDCNCAFCAECMKVYVEFEIAQGAYDISCPDAQCPLKGVLHEEEIKRLAGSELFEKHKKYRLNREIELDKSRTWCPRAGCETVCKLCPTQQCQPQSVHCPNCTTDFCSNCKLEWHDGLTCEDNSKKLAKEGKSEDAGIPFNSDLIKCCPMCNVPIEKDEGCAQMMCKRCKHVFCWYCLASLDDDFLLRHYDKGPCKNKLGHSRASVIWHRTQVIGIFAGFGILLLVASPLLLLAAPCIVCCKCRVCNAGTTKLDNDEEPVVEES